MSPVPLKDHTRDSSTRDRSRNDRRSRNRLICVLGTRDGSMVPAAQMERYEPVAEVSTWPRTAPDIDPGTVIGGRVLCRVDRRIGCPPATDLTNPTGVLSTIRQPFGQTGCSLTSVCFRR